MDIKTNRLLVFFAAFFLAFTVSQAAADSAKVGGVNLQRILDGSEAGKKALAELKGKAESERKILKEKQESIKAAEKELEQQRLMLSPSALADKERKVRRMKRELELYREDTQQILQNAQAQVMRRLLNDVMKIIKEYGEKNGYTMILEKGESANVLGGIVLYMDSAVDLTGEIIKIYDKRWKAGEIKSGG